MLVIFVIVVTIIVIVVNHRGLSSGNLWKFLGKISKLQHMSLIHLRKLLSNNTLFYLKVSGFRIYGNMGINLVK